MTAWGALGTPRRKWRAPHLPWATAAWLWLGLSVGVPATGVLGQAFGARRPQGLRVSATIAVEALPQAPSASKVAECVFRLNAHDLPGAQASLVGLRAPAAHLMRARLARRAGDLAGAADSLAHLHGAVALAPLVQLEAGRLAWDRAVAAEACAQLWPLFEAGGAPAAAALATLIPALTVADPAKLLRELPRLMAALRAQDVDGHSLAIEAGAMAHAALGQSDAARDSRLERFLRAPVSALTPAQPPVDVTLTAEQRLARIDILLAANRNRRALDELAALDAAHDTASLAQDANLFCRKHMAVGVAARRLHHYAQAEHELGWVAQHCVDDDLVRRASYLMVKVISIQDGLRAIAPVEAFVQRWPAHSMADDVLFWAGDIYQRRGLWPQAQAYYERIESLPQVDDMCSEARWRLAWMAWRAHDWPAARIRLTKLLQPDACPMTPIHRARAHYWLGRLGQEQARALAAAGRAPATGPGPAYGQIAAVEADAVDHFRRVWEVEPLGFYAQQALPQLLGLLPPGEAKLQRQRLRRPTPGASAPLCTGAIVEQAALARGLAYLGMGLQADAAAEFAGLHTAPSHPRCRPLEAELLVVLLLDRAGEFTEAHARLRQSFAVTLGHMPQAADVGVWRAAYPQAYRPAIAAAERESGLPPYFLQALTREESAFNPLAVSWAEAYGLTQLLLPSAQAAGRSLRPAVVVAQGEQLLQPALSARLGGAWIGAKAKKYANNLGLALAAYNAGDENAALWWRKFAGQRFDVFAEEIGIEETRGYVQRVLTTYGIYRWLWTGTSPALAVAADLPAAAVH